MYISFGSNVYPLLLFFTECQTVLREDPNLPCAVGASALQPGQRSVPPYPSLPPPLSLLEPRWPQAVPLASPCHSCCLSPLCCYHCCSPAPTPHVSTRTLSNHTTNDNLSAFLCSLIDVFCTYLIHWL